MKTYILIITTLFTLIVSAQRPEPKEESNSDCTYLESANYIVNKESVFFENCAIHRKVAVDPKELRIVYKGLAFDNKTMIYNGIKLNIVPNNPKIVNSYADEGIYWVNKNLLYKNEVEMCKIDVNTFTALCRSYFKDVNHVYYEGEIIKDADTESFICDTPYSYDKNFVYHKGNKLTIIGNVKAINGYFFKDESTVYKYDYDFLLSLKPLHDLNVEEAKPIPKTQYGIINDTLYYHSKKTYQTKIDITKIKVFTEHVIGFENKIIYAGHAFEDFFDIQSVEVIESNEYQCLLKDKDGGYRIKSPNNDAYIMPAIIEEEPKEEPMLYTTLSPLKIQKESLLYHGFPITKKSLLTKEGMTDFDTLELVSVLKGYRMGCSRDTQSPSNYYILRNSQGYWRLVLSSKNTLSFIGKSYKY